MLLLFLLSQLQFSEALVVDFDAVVATLIVVDGVDGTLVVACVVVIVTVVAVVVAVAVVSLLSLQPSS